MVWTNVVFSIINGAVCYYLYNHMENLVKPDKELIRGLLYEVIDEIRKEES